MSGTRRTIVLECDEQDYDTLQSEIARQQLVASQYASADGELCYPEGTSNIPAICLAEAVRGLNEYRDLWQANREESP